VFLFGCWAAVHLALDPVLEGWWGADAAGYVHSFALKPLIWVLPAVVLIQRFRAVLPVSLKEMFTAPVRWLPALAVFGVLTALVLTSAWPKLTSGQLTPSFSVILLPQVLVSVGLCEELAFRGWLLNAMPAWGRWPGLLVNGLLFAAIHIPTWILDPSLLAGYQAWYAPLFLTVFGMAMGYLFMTSKNLLVPLVIHAWYDLLIAVLL
jgi:membrane protease YdiL (CAAX protease family)